MKQLINPDKWDEVLTQEEHIQFVELVTNIIGSATDRGYNYSDIMLAFYKTINMAAYEYEVETAL
jgi:hypothetical protein